VAALVRQARQAVPQQQVQPARVQQVLVPQELPVPGRFLPVPGLRAWLPALQQALVPVPPQRLAPQGLQEPQVSRLALQ
jgi:hypothetical protein